jgi:hypothetical protein
MHLTYVFLVILICIIFVDGAKVEVCNSSDCTLCQTFNTSFISPLIRIMGVEKGYVVCGRSFTSIYGTSMMTKELQIYYGKPNLCQVYLGGSYIVSCDNETQIVSNNTLGTCSSSEIYTCEPNRLVRYKFSSTNCTGTFTSDIKENSNCSQVLYGICAHLNSNISSFIIALTIFPVFLGICFSVYSSLPCFIFCNEGSPIAPIPKRDEIIARSTPQREVEAMMHLNGPASPSTVSEYSSSTFRGNAILLASCLMSSTNLLLLRFIAGAIQETGERQTKWIRTVSYLLISLVGFMPSSPPSKIREKTPVLWCSFGSDLCNGKFDTSIIQDVAHMLSFFAAIILFIISDIIEYGGNDAIIKGDYNNTSIVFPVVLIILLGFLIIFQAPINISKSDSLSCFQYSFMNNNPTKNEKRILNAFAGASFLVEVILATCLLCFGLYEELLPVSECVDIESIRLFPWIIIVCSSIIGYTAGLLFEFFRHLKENSFLKTPNSPS